MAVPSDGDDVHSGLFDGLRVYVSKSILEPQAKQLVKILTREHAQFVNYNDPSLTHFVTESVPTADSLEYAAPRTGLYYVTPFWIERTIILGTRQEPDFYSPHPAMLFSGVVATASDLSRSDNEVMAAGISSLGGQWRYALTRDVTHLFALGTGSLKYRTAMHYKDEKENDVPLPIKVLVPHWFDDVVRLGVRHLPTEPYEWPEPRVFAGHAVNVLKATGASAAETGEEDRESRRGRPLSSQKKALYDTIFQDTIDLPKHRPASNDTWVGRKIMFGSNLGFTDRQREAHVADVIRGGGEVVEYESPEDELEKLEKADVYIAQYRSGRAFVKAYKLKKNIGNLHWFWTPIAGFSRHLITVTNFTGKDREYIKKLLLMLGVPYTATMTGKNTAVIAAFVDGEKTDRASLWGIPIVNHMWLEDCFAQWRDISPAQDKYTTFPPGVNFGDLLADDGGRAGLGLAGGTSAAGRVGYDQAELDRMEAEIEAEAELLARVGGLGEKENKAGGGLEVTETPKRGILKKSRGAGEDAAATARRLAAKRVRRGGGEDGDGDEVVEGSSGVFQDLTVALDDDGRLSMTGSELGFEPGQQGDDEDQMDVDASPTRQVKQTKQDKAMPATPTRGRPRGSTSSNKLPATPQTKATPSVQARPNTKPKPIAALLPSPSDDEEDDLPSPTRPKPTPAAAKPKTKAIAEESEDEQQSIEEAPRAGRPASRRAAMKGKPLPKSSTKVNGDESDAFVQGSSARKGTVIKTYRSKSRSRSRSRPRALQHEDVAEARPSSSKSTLLSQRRARPSGGDAVELVIQERVSSKKPPVTPKATSARKRADVPTDTEDEADSPAKSKARRASTVERDEDGLPLTASPADARTPRRRASVLLPTLAQVRSTSSQRPGIPEPPAERPASTRKKAVAADASLVVQARDAPQESPKRGRPPTKRPAAPKPVTPESSLSRSSSPPSISELLTQAKRRPIAPAPAPEPGPSRTVDAPPAHGRRSAATKAAQKLHEEIMPDVARFQKELKSGHVKSAHEEERVSARGKGKEREAPPKGRKRTSLEGAHERDSDDEPEKKKRKTEAGVVPAKGKGRKPDAPVPGEDDEVVVEEPKKRGRPAGKSKGETQTTETQTDAKGVVIMTTQVNLSDDQTKALTKMGVKFTTKPLECTHLVARGIVRTEKFLVAMAVAPHVVTDKWVEMSISKKKLLPEKDYVLKDPENEKRYGYKLVDALARARKAGRKLFEGKTFYITPKVPVDAKLLKAVITAGGGQFSSQNPTVRVLKGHDNRFVISSPPDVSIWRPLAESGLPVYSQELVLTSVLRQQIEWDNKGYLVPGSY